MKYREIRNKSCFSLLVQFIDLNMRLEQVHVKPSVVEISDSPSEKVRESGSKRKRKKRSSWTRDSDSEVPSASTFTGPERTKDDLMQSTEKINKNIGKSPATDEEVNTGKLRVLLIQKKMQNDLVILISDHL